MTQKRKKHLLIVGGTVFLIALLVALFLDLSDNPDAQLNQNLLHTYDSDNRLDNPVSKSSSITYFDNGTSLFSEDFIDQFTIGASFGERWLGVLINQKGIYKCYHLNMDSHESSLTTSLDLNLSDVNELYICNPHIDYFVGQVVLTDTDESSHEPLILSQEPLSFSLVSDMNEQVEEDISCASFKGFIDLYAVDLSQLMENQVTPRIQFTTYAGEVDGNPDSTWIIDFESNDSSIIYDVP